MSWQLVLGKPVCKGTNNSLIPQRKHKKIKKADCLCYVSVTLRYTVFSLAETDGFLHGDNRKAKLCISQAWVIHVHVCLRFLTRLPHKRGKIQSKRGHLTLY